MFESIDASFDRDEPFVLPSRNYHHVRELIHRWLSIAFTAAIIVNIVALVREEQAVWVAALPQGREPMTDPRQIRFAGASG